MVKFLKNLKGLKKESLLSLIFRSTGIVINYAYVPLLISYLDTQRYGIWLVILSFVSWFNFFDAGLGNGLRNKLTESLAQKDYLLSKKYVSTTYVIISFISLALIILFLLIAKYINWNDILNTDLVQNSELNFLAQVVFCFFFIKFIFQLIVPVLFASQKSSFTNIFNPLSNLIIFLFILILKEFQPSNLIVLGFISSIIPVIVLALFSIYLFNNDLNKISPSLKFFRFNLIKDLLNTGFSFLFLQLSSLIMFSTTNFLIAKYIDLESVTSYNVIHKYFQIPIMLYSITLNPLWSAVTKAKTEKNYDWLVKTFNKLNYVSLLFVLLILIMFLLSDYMINLWIGKNKLNIHYSLKISLAIFTSFSVILIPFSSFVNGLGKLRIHIINASIKIILFLPLSIFLLKNGFGVSSVVWLLSVFLFINILINFKQISMIINPSSNIKNSFMLK